MLAHYFSIAYRHLTKNLMYSLITIVGLAVGLASVFLIFQFVKTELSYDRFHESAETFIELRGMMRRANTNPILWPGHVRDFPEVESAVSLTPLGDWSYSTDLFGSQSGKRTFTTMKATCLPLTVLSLTFYFPLEKGDPGPS